MPKIQWDGDASGAESATKKVGKAIDGVAESAKTAEKEAARLTKQAERIKESINPQEKLNRLYRELGQHVKAGRLTLEEAAQAGVKYRRELMGAAAAADRVGDAGRRAFSPGDFIKAAAAMKGVTIAIQLATEAFQEFVAERERIANLDRSARGGIGMLAQLAAGEEDPEAAYARLTEEARSIRRRGATKDLDEAGQLLFSLSGAGLNRQERDFAVELRKTGVLQNVGGAAEAYSAARVALGEQEVGDFRSFMSKALRAAGPAPGSFEQLPIAAVRGGGSARALGVSDEFLLAATTIAGMKRGSIDEGGTQVAAFLKQLEQSGLQLKGLTGIEMVEKIASLPEAQQGYGGALGDRAEAIEGYRTLKENLAELKALEAKVTASVDSDLAGRAAGLPYADRRQRAGLRRDEAEGEMEEVTADQVSEFQNLKRAVISDLITQMRENNPGAATEMRAYLMQQDALTSGAEVVSPGNILSINQDKISDPELRADVKEYLRRTAEAAETTERQQRSRSAARPE